MEARQTKAALAVLLLCLSGCTWLRGVTPAVATFARDIACGAAAAQVDVLTEDHVPELLAGYPGKVAARVCRDGVSLLAQRYADGRMEHCAFVDPDGLPGVIHNADLPEPIEGLDGNETVGEVGGQKQWLCFATQYDACAAVLGEDDCAGLAGGE